MSEDEVTWMDTDPPLWEAQVGPGQWGMPLISRKAFGDTELHFPSDNSGALPLSTVGQSLTLYDSGIRTFSSLTEGHSVRGVLKATIARSKLTAAELNDRFSAERVASFRKSTQMFRIDVGPRMAMADVKWTPVGTSEEEVVRIMVHAQETRLMVEVVAPENSDLDPAYATTREEFDEALPSLHQVTKHDFEQEITQVLFDHPAGSGIPATRLLVRTVGATWIVEVGKSVKELFTNMTSTSYYDVRDDKHVNCDIQGDRYAAVTADGTWRVYSLETGSSEADEEAPTSPPIVAQGYNPRLETLSEWKSVTLLDGGDRMVLATRKHLRLFTIRGGDDSKPNYVDLHTLQHAGDLIMDVKRDLKYPNLLVVLSPARLMVFDLNKKDVPYLQISRTLYLNRDDASVRLSMSLVEGNSIAIVHSQLSLQKMFYTYAYTNPEQPLLLDWVCDSYNVLLLTQTPINTTQLVEFSNAIVMLYDMDIDGCVVRKLLTSEPSKFQDYKPEPVAHFPGSFKRGEPPETKKICIKGYDELMLPPPPPEPSGASEIAEKLDNLIKTWHKDGCPGDRVSLADLGADYLPSSIDEFGEMLGELRKHYNTSAVRVTPGIDPVKKYEEMISIYVTPTHETSDQGNALLAKFIVEQRIKTEQTCRRLAAMQAYMGCTLRRSKEPKGNEKEQPLHISKILDEWVVGTPPKTSYDDWVEFSLDKKKKRRALTQQELLSQVAASRNAIPKLSLSSQAPSQRTSLAPSQRQSLAPSQRAPSQRPSLAPPQRAPSQRAPSLAPSSSHQPRSSLARVASQDTRRQSAGPSGSQGGSQKKRRKTLGGFR